LLNPKNPSSESWESGTYLVRNSFQNYDWEKICLFLISAQVPDIKVRDGGQLYQRAQQQRLQSAQVNSQVSQKFKMLYKPGLERVFNPTNMNCPSKITLKVVGNEKEGGSRRWQMIGSGLRPRRSRFVCLIILLLSLILSISVSAPVKKNE
jgi:hypothetical protein